MRRRAKQLLVAGLACALALAVGLVTLVAPAFTVPIKITRTP